MSYVIAPPASGTVPLPRNGTVSATAGSTTLTGAGTIFLSQTAPGDALFITGIPVPVLVASVQSDTSLTLTAAPSTSANGVTVTNFPSITRFDDSNGNQQLLISHSGAVLAGSATVPLAFGLAPLAIQGTESTPTGTGVALRLANLAPGGSTWNLRVGATGTNTPAGGFGIAKGTTNDLVIDGAGKVGIGTNAPAFNLDVTGQVRGSTGLCINTDCRSAWPASSGGTVTSVATGTGLTGGPITSTGTIAFDTTFGDGRYARLGAANVFTAGQSISSGNLTLGSGNLLLPKTLNSATGVVFQNTFPLLHTFGSDTTNFLFNLFLGTNAGNFATTGTLNTGLGQQALLKNTTGATNTATGYQALVFNTSGGGNTANGAQALWSNTQGASNVALGAGALGSNTTGNNNTALGASAGGTVGANPANITGSNNTFIGFNANVGNSTVIHNATAIGANAQVTESDAVILGDATASIGIGTSAPRAHVEVANGDIYLSTPASAVILKSPDGNTCARLTIDNTGAIATAVTPCP